MITGDLKNRIDSLWSDFWTGGITNPLTVIEQITFLMYARLLDKLESRDEKRRELQIFSHRPAANDGVSSMLRLTPTPHRFQATEQDCRWQNWHQLSADAMLPHVRDRVFNHFRNLAERTSGDTSLLADFMKDAQLMIQKATLLAKAVEVIHQLPLDQGDTKGDLYEYLLSKLTTAGINGQFRTPRHIIRMMVELTQPKKNERICDPACGTGGFLVESYDYLLRTNSSKAGTHTETYLDERGNTQSYTLYAGDLLQAQREHIDHDMFHGFDFDATMLRIASMNLIMHGVASPNVRYQDTLSQQFAPHFPQDANNGFDLILANPPFKGSLDEEDVAQDLLQIVKTKKTELLFLGLILRMLKVGGRSATIVPDGVLFGASRAHQQLRRYLVEENQVQAIISLPNGAFKPYAGVSTGIILFTKGGSTDQVFFYEVTADGFTLDDKRQPCKDNDLPDVIVQWQRWQQQIAGADGANIAQFTDRTQAAFAVSKDEIAAQNYDLSINRYKKQVHSTKLYADPHLVLQQLLHLEEEIKQELHLLKEML